MVAICDNEECYQFPLPAVSYAVICICAIGCAIALFDSRNIGTRLNLGHTLAHGEHLARASEMGGALELYTRCQSQLVELYALFHMKRRKCSYAAVTVRTKQVARVLSANYLDIGMGPGLVDQLSNRHIETLRNAMGDGERRVCPGTLDLAEHGAADTRVRRQLIKGESLAFAQVLHAVCQNSSRGLDSAEALR